MRHDLDIARALLNVHHLHQGVAATILFQQGVDAGEAFCAEPAVDDQILVVALVAVEQIERGLQKPHRAPYAHVHRGIVKFVCHRLVGDLVTLESVPVGLFIERLDVGLQATVGVQDLGEALFATRRIDASPSAPVRMMHTRDATVGLTAAIDRIVDITPLVRRGECIGCSESGHRVSPHGCIAA